MLESTCITDFNYNFDINYVLGQMKTQN